MRLINELNTTVALFNLWYTIEVSFYKKKNQLPIL